jgi:hypothetical protein
VFSQVENLLAINSHSVSNSLFVLKSARKLECWSLNDITLVGDSILCRAVGAAEIPDLAPVAGCALEDEGAVLIESVSKGRGPKGLSIGELYLILQRGSSPS